MNMSEIKEKVISSEYDFLRTDFRLGENVILLGVGGSHAYGTETETSDLDIRGIATNNKSNILTMSDFEQVCDEKTDTTVYSLDKMFNLLKKCNPNTIELLGLKHNQYIHISPAGRMILDNKKLFLSKIAIHSFGGYAQAQLRRLENKSVRDIEQSRREEHILDTIKYAKEEFKKSYFNMPDDAINLYIDKAVSDSLDTEVFMDVTLNHYPLRDFKDMWSQMHSIVKSYDKIGKRNQKAIEHNKLGKHMMHLIRLYMMCIDILEKEEIITYRRDEHDLLMDIRNGKFLDKEGHPTEEFYDLLNEYDKRLSYASKHTSLPEYPNYREIHDLLCSINLNVVTR